MNSDRTQGFIGVDRRSSAALDGVFRILLPPAIATQLEPGSLDHTVVARELPDFNRLVFGHGRKPLRLGISGPLNLQAHDLRRFTQPHVLLQRRGAERTATSHGPINRPRLRAVLYRRLNLGADARAVRLDTYQPHADPIVAVSRVFEKPERMHVAWNPPADHFQQVFVSVIV